MSRADTEDEVLASFYVEHGFLWRYGPAGTPGATPPLQKKLCFTATSVAPMARILYELSLREDCFVVKLDVAPNPNGMVRGRCFMTTEEAIVELWLKYKLTDTVLCTIQDDDFTVKHRPKD